MAWIVVVMLVLAIISGILAWAFYHMCAENTTPDAANHFQWHNYFGWSTFFQGAALAFTLAAVILTVWTLL